MSEPSKEELLARIAELEKQSGFNAGIVRPTRERSMENTTPMTLESFAKSVYAHAYRVAA